MFNKTELDHLLWLVNERMQAIQQAGGEPSFSSANLEYAQLLDIEQALHAALENISAESANI